MSRKVNVYFDHEKATWVVEYAGLSNQKHTSPTVLLAIAHFYCYKDTHYVQGIQLNNYDDAPLPGMDLEFVRWQKYEIINVLGEKETILTRWESTQTGVVESHHTFKYVRLTTRRDKPLISVYNPGAIVTPSEWDEDAEFYIECCKYQHSEYSIQHYLETGKLVKASSLIDDQYNRIVECLVHSNNAAKAQEHFREVIMPLNKEWSEKLRIKTIRSKLC